jgi:hypothetical protein
MRKILLFMMVLMLPVVASADDVSQQNQNTIVIHQKDGKVATFKFSEKPVVTYVGNELVLTTTETTVQYPIYLLQKMAFDIDWNDPTAVEAVKKSEARFHFREGALCISGGTPGSTVSIYNLKGMKTAQYRLDGDGHATIPLQDMHKDVHVVKTDCFTFKFKKP